ncbi:unnamed protein product [Thelazia callipaeda]|uniref:FERM domain-containing protein n=1 Tax=Thelazia callipaeda TaxID=103827 RepID=A0A158RC13_THECL|nr:unnamed protein product [Thelazia callipaeda]
MHDGKRTIIHLLDGQLLELTIQPRLLVYELLNIIASHVALKEADKQYFALAYVDHLDQYHWLPTERRVLEYDLPRKSHQTQSALELHHSVKFFVDSVLTLSYPSAVELYFLEIARRLVKGLLEFTDLEYYKIASSFLQIYCGDYVSDKKARSALTELIPIPNGVLRAYDVSLEDIEKNVIDLYRDLSGVPKGVAILNFLQTAERSSTHGCHFYQVRDKSGQPWTIAVFTWSILDNLYYRDRKFSIEVRSTRVIQSSVNANSILDSTSCLDSDDELAKAVKDPTTQRSVASSAVQIHAFYCDSNFLCKTIWSTAISLHQFYLDQRTCASAKNILPNDPGVELKQLGEKLCRLISHSSVASSLPSLNSLSSNGMPSATVSDGSIVSLPSLNGVHSREKTEEEKHREIELYKQLKKRKNELEEKLLAKLDELREVCIKEAEITGELPKEIYKTLMPGEEEPKVQRRVGTAFSLNEEVFKRPVNSNDRISMLETDVELHRKIVAAAERLAKDKTTNKSVRKKRQKDLIAATQKLRGLEFGLSQLRLSASKPDVSSSLHIGFKSGDHEAESTSLGGRNDSHSLITKSCPATPRGSFPNLLTSTESEEMKIDDGSVDDGQRRASMECVQRYPSTSACTIGSPPHHIIDVTSKTIRDQSLGPKNLRRAPPPPLHHPSHFPCVVDRVVSWNKPSNYMTESHQMPIYENVGYRSCASYKSSYREMNFPTLNENSRDYSMMAASKSSDLNRQIILQQHSESNSFSSYPGLKFAGVSLDKCRQNSSSCCSSPPVAGLLLTDAKTPLRHAVLPTSRSCNDGFTTASLDRRAVKERQSSCSSMGYYHRLPAIDDSVQEMRADQQYSRHSAVSALRFTTFPVSSAATIGKGKLLSSTDIRRYHQHPPLQQCNSAEHSVAPLWNGGGPTGSSSNLRPPPPAYPIAVRNGIFGGSSSLEKAVSASSDLRMNTLMDYYKNKAVGRKKNATIV